MLSKVKSFRASQKLSKFGTKYLRSIRKQRIWNVSFLGFLALQPCISVKVKNYLKKLLKVWKTFLYVFFKFFRFIKILGQFWFKIKGDFCSVLKPITLESLWSFVLLQITTKKHFCTLYSKYSGFLILLSCFWDSFWPASKGMDLESRIQIIFLFL